MRKDLKYHGSAMLIVLWAVALVAFIVTGAIMIVKKNQEETTALNQMFQVRQAAESGLAIAMHPDIRENDPLLKGGSDLETEYAVRLVSEGSRLNINSLLKNETGAEILRRLFRRWGLSETDVSTVVSSLQDWVDDDDATRLNGAENDYYQKNGISAQLPRNHSFQDVNEMLQVRGIDILAQYRPDWSASFTTWSEGGLDLNDAPAELIEVVCDVSEAQANTLVLARGEMRQIADPKMRRWTEISQPMTLLGIPAEQQQEIEKQVTVTTDVWRIESTARMDKRQCMLTAVVRRKGNRQTLVFRNEQ